MTAPTVDPLRQAMAAQQAQTAAAQVQATRARLIEMLAVEWAALAAYRDVQAASFSVMAAAAVTAAQRSIAVLTASLLGSQIHAAGGVPGPVDLAAIRDLRGVPSSRVYARPFTQLWAALSKGVSFENAVKAGENRLLTMAATDSQLAKTITSQQVIGGSSDVVTGWRRVLNGPSSCALCTIASEQVYRKSDLAPIHDRCDCSVMAVTHGQQAPDLSSEQLP